MLAAPSSWPDRVALAHLGERRLEVLHAGEVSGH
jgi:hypothetical protein